MATYDLGEYRITLTEMSRRSQIALSTWFNAWLTGPGSQADKVQVLAAISTQVILHSKISLYRGEEKLPDGTHQLTPEISLTLPLTETCLNDELPASLVAWMVDAAGQENGTTLAGFLAGVRVMTQNMRRSLARVSDSGPSGRSTPA